MISRDADLFDMQSRLLAWLREKMPQAENITVSELERSGAGFTNESFLFDLTWEEGGELKSMGMILRCEGTRYPVYPDPKVQTQFRILQRLEGRGVPVPRVFWFEEDEGILGTQFYLMERLEGQVPSEFPPYHSYGICYDASPENTAGMWWQLIEAVAKLHKLDFQEIDLSFLGIPSEGTGPVDRDLDYWERYLQWLKETPDESHPILETALEWLKANCYVPERVALCWGDARLPNTIFSSEYELLGLLDWDIAHLGDPESDLAFILTLDYLLGEGIGVPRLEGFPSKEETIRRYEELAGAKVRQFFYNEVRAAFVTGLHVVRVQRNLRQLGVSIPGEDPDRDNFCTQYLAGLLDLPAPSSIGGGVSTINELEATIQFHLTGSGGSDWYLECNRGDLTRRDGVTENPDTKVILPAGIWSSIRRGEMNQFHAWTSGQLQIEGDHTLLHLLEAVISRLEE